MQTSLGKKNNRLLNLSVIALIALLAITLLILSFAELTNRESAFLGTVLTFASILAGGLISHAYAQESHAQAIADVAELHQKNLRTYALKAAEKVNNLSKEISRLSSYLESELSENDYRSVDEELHAKEERIESAIHMLTTLKSVNDTGLSDWQGVIGDELYEKKIEEAERTEELNSLLDRFSTLEAAQLDAQKKFDSTVLYNELNEVRRDLRNLATTMTGVPLKRPSEKTYISLNEKCPACSSLVPYRQKPHSTNLKALKCNACGVDLVSGYTEEHGFSLALRKSVPETISCPSCEAFSQIELDEWPTASTTVKCQNCEETVRISRASGEIKVAVIPQLKSKYPLNEEIIEKVRLSLPQQPWPRQVHKTVAEALDLPHQQVQKAIQHLIRIGAVMDQVDGHVCTTEEKLKIMRDAGSHL